MDERFTYLVQKHLDNSLEGAEIIEFDRYLENSDCMEYLEKAKVIDKLIEEGMRQIVADPLLVEDILSEPTEFDKQIEQDILKYGGANISDETREKVRRMHEEMLKGKKRNRFFIYAAIAASVLIGLFFLWPDHQKPSPRLLYKQYYKTFEFITIRGLPETIPEYDKAMYAYMGGDNKASARMCREILANNSPDAESHFLYGLNLMEMDSMEQAIQQFRTTTSFPMEKGERLYVSAIWYESLAFLAMGKTDSALVKLDEIRGGDNLFVLTLKVDELMEGIKALK